jgi:hypothetical protein
MMAKDRLNEAFDACVRSAVPGVDYMALYRARVVSQHASTGKLDVEPDDARLPTMSNLRLKLGLPGASVKLALEPGDPPVHVLVGWEGGDPGKPYATIFETGATVVKLVLAGTTVILGSEAGAEGAALGATLQAFLNQVATLLVSHTHVGVQTGAGTSGPSPALAAIATPPNVVAAKVQVA